MFLSYRDRMVTACKRTADLVRAVVVSLWWPVDRETWLPGPAPLP